VYGAIATAGEWGLKHRCAVAYADKGSGMGVHHLSGDTVNLIDGTRATRAAAGKTAHFAAALGSADLASFNASFPNRIAVKHAHSQQNPEKDWGRNTLQAVQFAFYLLNTQYGSQALNGEKYDDYAQPGKVTIIASSVSNGAGAALLAAEQDTAGYISGVAVGEPQIQPASMDGITIQQGGNTMPAVGKPLLDYFTAANLYQPCAVQSSRLAGANSAYGVAVNAKLGAARCAALAAKGIVTGATLEDQASDAYNKLIASGWLPEGDALHASHYGLNATLGVTMAYVNAYGRFSVKDNARGYSYAFTNATGDVIAPLANNLAGLFGNGNGVPPTGGISIVNNLSIGGGKADAVSVSVSTGAADYNVDGAICLRKLATGKDPATGAGLAGDEKAQADRVAQGIREVQASGKLRGKPVIMVAGRSDSLVPVNNGARAYYALNQKQDGAGSRLRYIEVTNGQHFDSFLALPGFPTRFIPMHVYFLRAMDAMYANLTTGAPLPASQVVRTTPRAAATDSLTAAALPAIASAPAAGDTISYAAGVLAVPN
jgi:hydroxybutyrate-dimer hydrolase